MKKKRCKLNNKRFNKKNKLNLEVYLKKKEQKSGVNLKSFEK